MSSSQGTMNRGGTNGIQKWYPCLHGARLLTRNILRRIPQPLGALKRAERIPSSIFHLSRTTLARSSVHNNVIKILSRKTCTLYPGHTRSCGAIVEVDPCSYLAQSRCDETGVYKNLLQEISRRVGAPLPSYTTIRSGLGHQPVFTCNVELAGISFTGGPAKNKKQAEKNAAMAAWNLLKRLAKEAASSSSTEPENNDEQDQITIARALLNYRSKERIAMANNSHSTLSPKMPPTGSKILPLLQPKSALRTDAIPTSLPTIIPSENRCWPSKIPTAGALRYVPVRHHGVPFHAVASPVTIRTAVPVFSAPPRLPPPAAPRSNHSTFAASPEAPPSSNFPPKELPYPAAVQEVSPEVPAVPAKEPNHAAVVSPGPAKDVSPNTMASPWSRVPNDAHFSMLSNELEEIKI
ncbi:Double-stranded RNA-binding protein 6 [Platanthera guangdongensis]|uniref:Double-stranded RNA-binding protein 6 n=1 Tax=Platanthera guangdongensis TaxID=2320717 RepID=A0ABR2MRH8_9ASPA